MVEPRVALDAIAVAQQVYATSFALLPSKEETVLARILIVGSVHIRRIEVAVTGCDVLVGACPVRGHENAKALAGPVRQ